MILVFGGGGQLGCELVRLGKARSVPLSAMTRTDADISDPAAVRHQLDAWKPLLVVNAAAYTAVDRAEGEPAEAHRCNALGPAVLALACAAADIPLIHVSTDYVFDGRKGGAYLETDPLAPLGAYGRSKAAGEAAVADVAKRHVILRTSWVYGEFGRNFLKTMLGHAQERDELRVVDDQRGSPTSTRNLAEAILHIAPRLSADASVAGIYHFAGRGVTTWHGFASRIVDAQAPLTGRRPKVVAVGTAEFPTAARRPANSELDCGKFERDFGFRARPWEQEADAAVWALAGTMRRLEPAILAGAEPSPHPG